MAGRLRAWVHAGGGGASAFLCVFVFVCVFLYVFVRCCIFRVLLYFCVSLHILIGVCACLSVSSAFVCTLNTFWCVSVCVFSCFL